MGDGHHEHIGSPQYIEGVCTMSKLGDTVTSLCEGYYE